MSNNNLSLVFDEPNDAQLLVEDGNGWTLDDWFNDGFMGWDDGLRTFFLNLQPETLDGLAWSFGRTDRQLTSPYDVQAILGALVGVNGFEAFPFKPDMLARLMAQRDATFAHDQRVLTELRADDARHRASRGARRPPAEWIEAHRKAGVPAEHRHDEPVV